MTTVPGLSARQFVVDPVEDGKLGFVVLTVEDHERETVDFHESVPEDDEVGVGLCERFETVFTKNDGRVLNTNTLVRLTHLTCYFRCAN